MSGLISYKVDGLEDELTVDNFANFNKEAFESYNLKTGQTVATSEEARKDCK